MEEKSYGYLILIKNYSRVFEDWKINKKKNRHASEKFAVRACLLLW